MIIYWLLLLYSLSSVAFDPLAFLSDNQKKGIDEYKQAIGVNVSGNENIGLSAYNNQLLKNNRCFKKLAEDFYFEIRKEDVNFGRNTKRPRRPSDAPSFSIDDRVLDSNNQRGKFWETALRYAGGNKNLAMSLVGVCGHDNMIPNKEILCPTEYSNIYYPESLGEGVDISPALRQKVLLIQGDNGSGLYIPYKYYHTIGAASTACLMLRRGVPAVLARTIVTTAVNGYRSGRLCENFLSPRFLGYTLDDRTKMSLALKDGPQSKVWKEIVAKTRGLSQKSLDVQRKKIEIALSHLDAQDYFRIQSPIMDECQKTKMSGQLVSFLKSYGSGQKFQCPSSMDNERCGRLKHRIQTWAVDREWTEAQHLAGLDFAQKNCPADIVNGDEIEKSSCALVENSNPDRIESTSSQ